MSLYERVRSRIMASAALETREEPLVPLFSVSDVLGAIKPILDEYEKEHTAPPEDKYPRWFVYKDNRCLHELWKIGGESISDGCGYYHLPECHLDFYLNSITFEEITQAEADAIIEQARLNARWRPPAAD